ncbi:MaoC family dehydratase [Streptomyces sp. NBC_01795]|nr:MaoC family dehydratase [Streptomyces sp. NBC_01795]WSS17597.1 MaoC family dehydratase [Streptomyces sp. NBC_01186]
MPPLAIPVTRTLIVSGAVASRDFQDVHHDAEAARDKGSPDIFMNILTTNGLVGRYVTEWAGPHARLRKVAVRLGVPNHPGDTMTLTGRVTSVTAPGTGAPDATRVEVGIAVTGENSLGAHVTGAVTLVLTLRTPGSAEEPQPKAGTLRQDEARLTEEARQEGETGQEGEPGQEGADLQEGADI